MLGNLRKFATGGASSVWKKFLTLTVATGLAASMTLGATPVSATTASWEDWALEVDNSAPQWGDVVEFSAEINWTTCKRIPIVYLLGTSDNGDPISVRLTGDQVTGKIYSYSISYGGVDEDGVPYDYELSSSERATLNDTRLAAGWHSFQLKATSTRANCPSLNRVQYSDAVEFYVGPQLTDVEFTTNATYDFDVTSGLISVLDDNEDDFTTGIYSYELTSLVGDSSSGLWIEAGEVVGDTLTVDASAGIDWDNNLSGVNCYLDEPVDLVGDPVADGHHVVDDTDALDCAAIDIDLGEHTLTVERWIDSCNEAGLDCLSWTTFTFDFARVENQDAMPYVLDFTDASTGVSLLEDPYEWESTDYTNTIFLDPDYSNGIEIVADLPFGADMSCIYDDNVVELSAGDVFEPSELPGDTYLVCTVTPEDPSAESFEYTVTIDRVSGNVGFTDLRVITERRGELVVSNSPMDTYDEEVDYTAGIASRRDDTAGIELTLDDESADFNCFAFDSYDPNGLGAGTEEDCAAFPLNTPDDPSTDEWPEDYTTGVWIEIDAEDGTSVWYLLIIESDDATLGDMNVRNVADVELDMYDNTNGVVIEFNEDIFEYHLFVTASDIGVPPFNGVDVVANLRNDVQQTRTCFKGYMRDGETESPDSDCSGIVIPVDALDDYYVRVRVLGASGRHNDYFVFFTYQDYSDGLEELEVDGLAVQDDIDLTPPPVVLDGNVFDGDYNETWYAVTDEATADISYVLGDLPGLSAHCYREGVLDADCQNIALSVSDYTTVTVVTKTGGVGGVTKRTYTIEIYRSSTVKTLATLTANNGSAMRLTPTFSPTTYTYASSSLSSLIDVSYTTTSGYADADCVDDDADSTTDCQDIDVSDGDVEVTITVTAENGDEQVYTLNLSEVPPVPAPEYLSRASVRGTAAVGKVLTASVGTWRYQPEYEITWYRCDSKVSLQRGSETPEGCEGIYLAFGSTYRLIANDRNKFILAKIVGVNAGGETVIYTSSTRAVR
jgi:hypothetical protein